MIRYLNWLSVAGVWFPTFAWVACALVGWAVGLMSLEAGAAFYVIGVFLTFALCHALAISSIAGIGLLITRKANSPVFTLVSATAGALISGLVLSRVYLNAAP